MLVENTVSGTAPESPISIQLGNWDHTHTHHLNTLCFFETPLSVTEIYGSQNNEQLGIFTPYVWWHVIA